MTPPQLAAIAAVLVGALLLAIAALKGYMVRHARRTRSTDTADDIRRARVEAALDLLDALDKDTP